MNPLFLQYANLIESMIVAPQAFVPAAEDASHLQVERGIIGPVIECPQTPVQIVDAGGHARPVYRPLLLYSWLRNCRIGPAVFTGWVQSLQHHDIWSALVLSIAGERFQNGTWTDEARLSFNQLIDQQRPGGAFLPVDSKANPETRWYEELLLLHALASYSVGQSDPRIHRAVERGALFHLEETQPDHASAQPWALLAFVQYAPLLADQVLHALSMQYPAGVTGVPLLLLTDALYGLRRLIETNSTPDHGSPIHEQRS